VADFPANVSVLLAGYSEGQSDIVERAEMDRGFPKQRRTQSDLVITLSVTLQFETVQAARDFKDWYYSPTGAAAGAAFFNFTLPCTSPPEIVQARVVANSFGPASFQGPASYSRRALQIEYLETLPL